MCGCAMGRHTIPAIHTACTGAPLPTCIVAGIQRRRHSGQHQRARLDGFQVAARHLQNGLHVVCKGVGIVVKAACL